jgi:heme exporter protein A
MPPTGAFSPIALEAEELACARGGLIVFSNKSFRIASKQMLMVTGPNGSGKSSLLRLVAGLLTPHAGTLRFDGCADEAVVRHYLGHAEALKPVLTLRETLQFWAVLYRANCRDEIAGENTEGAATMVGLDHALDLPIRVLSAGQRRRATLARLLIAPRPLWLLDEPTAALDRDGEVLLASIMRTHLAADGLIIAATHAPLPVAADVALDLGGAT